MPRKGASVVREQNAQLDDLAVFFENTNQIDHEAKKKEIDELLTRYPEMSRSLAGQIAGGSYPLRKYLAKRAYKVKFHKQNKIDELMQKYPQLTKSIAGQIITGHLDLDSALKTLKIKKIKEEKREKFRQKIADLLSQYPDMLEKTAKKIAIGQVKIDDYLASLEKKKIKQQKNPQK